MEVYITILVFIFGTIIGSFLNVVALRFNIGAIKGRSQCFSCGYQLKWHDLIPVLSFVAFHGKCRKCKSPISYQYPLVEVATGALFSLLFWKFIETPYILVAHLVIAAILVVVVIYDLKHKIIPNILSYLFVGASFLLLFAQGIPTWWQVAGVLVSVPFWFIVLLSKETWMGGGDAKLAMGIGWLLGISLGFSALAYATWVASIVGIPLLFIHKKGGTMRRIELPFAPFLIVGMYIALFTGLNIFYVNSFV